MSTRSARRLAWSLFGLYVLSVAATLALVATGVGRSDDTFVVLAFGYAAVGALVATREPTNSIGWLLLVAAVTYGLGNFAYADARHVDHPGEVAVAWYADVGYVSWLYITAILLPMLFPTGGPLSPRWRAAVALVLAGLVLSIVGVGLREGTLDVQSPEPISNPLAISGPLANVVAGAGVLGGVLGLTGFVLGVVSLILRMRRSRGRERQQLKVFAYVVVALLLDAAIFVTGIALNGSAAPAWVESMYNFGWLASTLLLTLGLPLAVGVAILRHRLYAIDVVINRTLVYGALTLTLAMSYLGSVLLFRLLLNPLTGQSDLAVAGSTLTVAALFRPLRSRIQSVVDRRFYRARYDATRTLKGFTTHLRDELDLETLGTDLRAVVHDTMQPAHVTLWLRSSP